MQTFKRLSRYFNLIGMFTFNSRTCLYCKARFVFNVYIRCLYAKMVVCVGHYLMLIGVAFDAWRCKSDPNDPNFMAKPAILTTAVKHACISVIVLSHI